MPRAAERRTWRRRSADWPRARRGGIFAAAETNHPNRRQAMGKLFFHMGVFAVVTFVIYLVCLQFVRIEERREARRQGRNS